MATCQGEALAGYVADAPRRPLNVSSEVMEMQQAEQREWMENERKDVLARVLAYRSCAHPG